MCVFVCLLYDNMLSQFQDQRTMSRPQSLIIIGSIFILRPVLICVAGSVSVPKMEGVHMILLPPLFFVVVFCFKSASCKNVILNAW